MEQIQIIGRLVSKSEKQHVSDKFVKREFVVETNDNPQYPEYHKLEFIQDKCSLLDGYRQNEMVEVMINLRGRKWDSPNKGTQYFNTLQAWKISKYEEVSTYQIKDSPVNGGSDDLPF